MKTRALILHYITLHFMTSCLFFSAWYVNFIIRSIFLLSVVIFFLQEAQRAASVEHEEVGPIAFL